MYTLLRSRLVSRSTSPLAYNWFWELHEGLEAKIDTLPHDSIRGRQEKTGEGGLWFGTPSSSPHQPSLLKSLPVPCVRRVASDICPLHHRSDDYSLLAVCILRSFSTWLLIWVTDGPVSLLASVPKTLFRAPKNSMASFSTHRTDIHTSDSSHAAWSVRFGLGL